MENLVNLQKELDSKHSELINKINSMIHNLSDNDKKIINLEISRKSENNKQIEKALSKLNI